MISTKNLIKMARKWQRKVAIRRTKGITLPSNASTRASSSSAPVAEKGHVVIYTVDQKRYSFPITYLNNCIFRELLRMAEEEFRLPSDGPITIPCDAGFMDYLISQIQRHSTKDIEKALLLAISTCRCSSSARHTSQRPVVYCF